ncbi:dipeptidase [Granulicella cerasi]|uniref:Dipeptidase n=1 Tax=Granulicella cerasi TaxID=741063 RepID=A0ABW1Z913_9BACT|nr:dipeptidase [Granulicella cerasi]
MKKPLIACLSAVLALQAAAQTDDAALIAKAHRIAHVIKMDTHNDIDPANFTATCNYTQRLTTQVNLPKMIEGGMDVSFMIVYVEQGPLTPAGYDDAYKQAIAKFEAIHRLTEQIAPDKFGLALTPKDVVALHKQAKKAVVIGVENGYPIGTDVARVKEFYDRGARYLSMAHNGASQLADSNTGETEGYLYNNGLSAEGREVVAEMNRLGMMVDLSHPAKGANLEAIRLSKAPVIASHSGVRALANVPRNMDDEQLLALKKSGGVIQINGVNSFLKPTSMERFAALKKLHAEFAPYMPKESSSAVRACPVEGVDGRVGRKGGGAPGHELPGMEDLPADKRALAEQRIAELNAKYPPTPRATVKDFVDEIDYAVKKIGVDHVGIASDFDGGGGIEGWDSAAEAFNVTLELVRRGYNEKQIAKLWGGNLLRVWGEDEKVARKLEKRAR